MPNISQQQISKKIYFVRNHKVMIDSDLAELYEVKTGALNRAVQRNIIRFPSDFMFQLTNAETDNLRCQIGTANMRRFLPYAFTEQGVAMLSSVLKSEKAALVNIEIMRSFVKLREILLSNQDLAQKLKYLEKKYDVQFKAVFDAIRELMNPSKNSTSRIVIVDTDKKE